MPGVSLDSCGLVLLVLCPAMWTCHLVITSDLQPDLPLLSWLKFWSVVALLYCLESLVTNTSKVRCDQTTDNPCKSVQYAGLSSVSSVPAVCLKLLLLCWCLAPVDNNGADVIFDGLVSPLHDLIEDMLSLGTNLSLSCFVFVLDDILQPLLTATQVHLLPAMQCGLVMLTNSPDYAMRGLEAVLQSGLEWVSGVLTGVVSILADPIPGCRYYGTAAAGVIQTNYHNIRLYYKFNEENPIFFSKLFKIYRKIFITALLNLTDDIWQSLRSVTEPLLGLMNSAETIFLNIVHVCLDNVHNVIELFSFEIMRLCNVARGSFISFSTSTQHYFHEAALFSNFLISNVLQFISKFANLVVGYFMMFYKLVQKFPYVNYEEEDRPPRLFSQVFKEMIK